MPPIERPQNEARSTPSVSSSASTSPPRSAIVYGPGGASASRRGRAGRSAASRQPLGERAGLAVPHRVAWCRASSSSTSTGASVRPVHDVVDATLTASCRCSASARSMKPGRHAEVARGVERLVDLLLARARRGPARRSISTSRSEPPPSTACARGAPRSSSFAAARRPSRSASARGHRLGHQQAAGRSRFARIRSASDLERPRATRAARRRRPAGQRSSVSQRLPLGLPGAGGALVLLRHRARAARAAAPGTRRAQATPRAARRHRVALVRQRRRAAASVADASADLADLGLREQRRRRARPCRARPPRAPSAPAELARRRTRAVCQGSAGSASSSSARQLGDHARARRRRATRACPPRRRAGRRAVGRAAASRAERRVEPSQPAAFSPNVIGSACWSSVRPAIGVRAVLRRRAAAQASATPVELLEDQLERARRDEHRRGVEHVLAGRAPVDVARRPRSRRPWCSASTSGPAGIAHVGRARERSRRRRSRRRRSGARSPPRPPRGITPGLRLGAVRARPRSRASPAARRGRRSPRRPPAPRAKRSPNRPSDDEEDGLAARPGGGCRSDSPSSLSCGDQRVARGGPRQPRRAPGRPRWPRPRRGSRSASTSRWSRPRANTDTSMCGACSAAVRRPAPGRA